MEKRIERNRARINARLSNARAKYSCHRPAQALATDRVQFCNEREIEKERYTKMASRRERKTKSVVSKPMRLVFFISLIWFDTHKI